MLLPALIDPEETRLISHLVLSEGTSFFIVSIGTLTFESVP